MLRQSDANFAEEVFALAGDCDKDGFVETANVLDRIGIKIAQNIEDEEDSQQESLNPKYPYTKNFEENPRGVDKTPYDFTDDQMYDFLDKDTDVRYNALTDFYNNPKARQTWNLVPAGRLAKIWRDYARTGVVRDVKGLDEIADIMLENVMKLRLNTELMGHAPYSPADIANEITDDEGWTDERSEDFGEHATDENGSLRISDYALEPLLDDAARVYASKTPEEKLLLLDRMLNRIHQRSDIAAMFIEGGSNTLNAIFTQ